MVVGGCIATGAAILQQYLGLQYFIGTTIIVLITILLSIYGAELVRIQYCNDNIYHSITSCNYYSWFIISKGDFSGHWQLL